MNSTDLIPVFSYKTLDGGEKEINNLSQAINFIFMSFQFSNMTPS